MNRPFPIRPAVKSTAADALITAAYALVKSQGKPDAAFRMLGVMPNSEPAEAILKAAVGPATTTQSGWAAELVQTSVADFLTTGLAPTNAGAALLRSALLVTQERGDVGTSVPSMLPLAAGVGFVAEGQPIPVKAFSTSLVALQPAKIATICAFTREMTLRSSFETISAAPWRKAPGSHWTRRCSARRPAAFLLPGSGTALHH